MWTLYLKTDKYYYWKHSDGYYNVTKDNNPPTSDSGYYSFEYLIMMKNDENFMVNGYKIGYNNFWHKWNVSHDEIGFIGSYNLIEDAMSEAENG